MRLAVAALDLSRRRFLAQAIAAAGLTAGFGLPARPRSAFADTGTVAAPKADWDVPGGHFYTQGTPEGAPPDTGYVVSDADGAPLWRDYRRLGGPAQLGYPVSARYEGGGVIYQAMQAALLYWPAAAGQTEVFPVFAAFAELDLDGWLEAQGIPPTAAHLLEDPELPLEARLAWLTHPVLRSAYRAPGEAESRRRYGLPMGEPERFGPYLAQRFEKAVLQLWLDALPGQPRAGTVSLVQVGDLLRAAKQIPEPALEPQPAPAPRPGAARASAGSADTGGPAVAARLDRYVVVSLERQSWSAYHEGQLVYSGPVTTGRPELPTPTGRFSVLSHHSPYLFVSPWRRGSPFWYEPSLSKFALRISGDGVFLHDAPWRPFYGPGTNVPHYDPDGVWRTGSHGCINMPYAAAQWLYTFAPVGTPVDVIA
jgi:lipoprotein-anchoring transpeptidase ErfK/SrfK